MARENYTAKVTDKKRAIVTELSTKLKTASGGVFVDYTGTSVAADTTMRRAMRAANVEYAVIKNTLTRFAANDAGIPELDPILNGPTALALSFGDPVAAARIINEFASKRDATIRVKAGIVEGKIITPQQVTALAELPSKEQLVAMLAGTLIAPIRGLATVLNANISGLARALQAVADQGGGSAAAPKVAEAPAVEALAEAPAVEASAEAPAVEASAEAPAVEAAAEAPAVEAVAEAPAVEAEQPAE
jgi:large subunit ribosomal protein L10